MLLELINFLFSRKKFWLFPIFIVVFLVGFVITFSQGTAVAPFVYTLF